jgi:two-component system, sensor histidine kinase and response regulator
MSNPALEPGEPENPTAGVVAWNPDQTLERLGGDEQLLHEVIEIFLDEVPKHLVELREAITRQDAKTAERVAHSLHGELGYLSIAELSHRAREIEEKGRTSDFQGALTLLPVFEASIARLLNSIGVREKTSSEGRSAPRSPGVSP